MSDRTRPIEPFPTTVNSKALHDLRVIYGAKLERLTPKAKRHLMILSALATEFGWAAAESEFFVGHSVPKGAVALAQHLNNKELDTLVSAISYDLRCGHTLSPPPQPTLWQRLRNWWHNLTLPY